MHELVISPGVYAKFIYVTGGKCSKTEALLLKWFLVSNVILNLKCEIPFYNKGMKTKCLLLIQNK